MNTPRRTLVLGGIFVALAVASLSYWVLSIQNTANTETTQVENAMLSTGDARASADTSHASIEDLLPGSWRHVEDPTYLIKFSCDRTYEHFHNGELMAWRWAAEFTGTWSVVVNREKAIAEFVTEFSHPAPSVLAVDQDVLELLSEAVPEFYAVEIDDVSGHLTLAMGSPGTSGTYKREIKEPCANTDQSAPEPSFLKAGPISSDTTGWVTYADSQGTFRILIPPTWKISGSDSLSTLYREVMSFELPLSPDPVLDMVLEVSIRVFAETERREAFSTQEEFEALLAQPDSDGTGVTVFKRSEFEIAGDRAVQYVRQTLPGVSEGRGPGYGITTWFRQDGVNYKIELIGVDGDDILTNLPYYDAAVRSFEFTQ